MVQEIFLSETAKHADVVLPGTTFLEKDGTFTNTERRVQRVNRAEVNGRAVSVRHPVRPQEWRGRGVTQK